MLQLVAIAVPEETSRSTLSPRSICNASELGEVGEGGAASTKESSSAPNRAVSNMCHSITTKSHHLSINIDQHPWTQQYFPWNDAFTHQWTRANLRNVGKTPDLVIPFIIVFLQFWWKPLHQYKTNKSAKRWSWLKFQKGLHHLWPFVQRNPHVNDYKILQPWVVKGLEEEQTLPNRWEPRGMWKCKFAQFVGSRINGSKLGTNVFTGLNVWTMSKSYLQANRKCCELFSFITHACANGETSGTHVRTHDFQNLLSLEITSFVSCND